MASTVRRQLSHSWMASFDRRNHADGRWEFADKTWPPINADKSTICHIAGSRDAVIGEAMLPVSPLHGEHVVTFRVAESSSGCGCIGIAGITPDTLHTWPAVKGYPAFGVELNDGGWRACTDGAKSAEQRGPLLPIPAVDDEIMLRINCRERALAIKSPAAGEWRTIPVSLPEDVIFLAPWSVSAFTSDVFTLVAVEAAEARPWTPRSHALFPSPARAFAVAGALLGHLLAARKLPPSSYGAFSELWLSKILPLALDEVGVARLVLAERVERLAAHFYLGPPEENLNNLFRGFELPIALRLLWERGREWHLLADGHHDVFGFNLWPPPRFDRAREVASSIFGDEDEMNEWADRHTHVGAPDAPSCAGRFSGYVCVGAFSEYDYLFVCVVPTLEQFGQVRCVTNNCDVEERVCHIDALIAYLLAFIEEPVKAADPAKAADTPLLQSPGGRTAPLNTPLNALRCAIREQLHDESAGLSDSDSR